MNENLQPKSSPWLKAWIAVRFVIFGVGGVIALYGGSVWFIVWLDSSSGRDTWAPLGVPLALLGSVMMLYGSGMWRRWLYLLVFLSLPLTVLVLMLSVRYFPHIDQYLPFGGKLDVVVLFVMPMIVVYLFVKRYYKRREAAQPSSVPEPQNQGVHQ